MIEAKIKAISYYLPDRIVTNEELVKDFPEWDAEKVSSKTGIIERHIAADDETASDMAIKAANLLFEEYNIDRTEIDFLLFCTQSPDYKLPTTACIIQNELNLPTSIGAIDFNLGCSGYIYGLSIAKGLIFGGIAKNILLITSETYSKYIHPKDKGNRSLFGDGASATLISTSGFAEIMNFSLGTNGEGANNLIVKTGGAKNPNRVNDYCIDDGAIKSSDNLYMNGSEIFNFTLDAVPPLVEATLKYNNLKQGDIDLFVFHQANKFMLNTMRKVCGIEKSKFYIDLAKTGNTVSSTIPIALKDLLAKNELFEKDLLLTGFGVGYSWGGVVLKCK